MKYNKFIIISMLVATFILLIEAFSEPVARGMIYTMASIGWMYALIDGDIQYD